MATMTSPIRWMRRGNSEIRNKSTSLIDCSSEAFKLPALNALNKSIKYNDLSFATSRDLRQLRKQPEQVDNIEELSAHHSLMVIRKKYDNMNKTREQIQRQVDEMEKKRDKFLTEKNKFQSDKDRGSAKVQELQEGLQAIKLQLEQGEMEKKVMLAMIERIKSDKVVYDLRKYKLEKQLAYIHKQKQIILRENAGKLEEQDKTRKIHQKLLDHLESEQNEREAHLNSMQTMIDQKINRNQNNEHRQNQMKEIAQNTLQDKAPQEKNWYKVYLCSKFVEKLLRDKMTREMMKFNIVEVAFKNIKTATGVNNTNELVKKFLNKENAYGELLGKIADNERNIAELKGQNEELIRERRKLETEQDELNSNRIESKHLEKEEKAMQAMAEKAASCKLLIERLAIWTDKNIKKFNSIDNKHQQIDPASNPKDIASHLKIYLQRLGQSAEQVTPVDQKAVDHAGIGGNNCRIQLEHKEEQKPHKKISKNQNDQEDFVNNQRSEILKNNDKFMKQIKKKYEDIKKAKLQAEPKKRQIIVEKPKPQSMES